MFLGTCSLTNDSSLDTGSEGASRSRAMTAGPLGSPTPSKESPAPRPTHTRAISERVVPSIKSPTSPADLERLIAFSANHASDLYAGPVPGYDQPAMTGFLETSDEREVESDPVTPQPNALGGSDANPMDAEGPGQYPYPRSRVRPGTPLTIANSLIDGENSRSSDDDDDEDGEDEGGQDAPPVPRKPSPLPNPAVVGLTLDNLVDRLVSLPIRREDACFNEAFLCLYRKFASPAQLLAALYDRWEALQGREEEPAILTLQSQLRIVTMLARWVAEYPGDCAHPLTRHYLSQVCEMLSEDRVFAAAAREIMDSVEQQIPDDDIRWSISDNDIGDDAIQALFPGLKGLEDTTRSTDSNDWFEGNGESFLKDDSDGESLGHRRGASSASGRSGDPQGSTSAGPLNTVLDSIEAAKAQAELLTPLGRTALTKVQWRQFMEYSDDELAAELTRMDWIMYSALHARELIRHVSLGQADKEKTRSLDHLNRMINHFNHVGYWTTSMILLRDKPKHRAKALEKFIDVARVSWRHYVNVHYTNQLTSAETASAEQLQFAGRHYRGHQRHRGAPAGSNARTDPASDGQGIHDAGNPHGHAQGLLCVPACVAKHGGRKSAVFAPAFARPGRHGRGQSHVCRQGQGPCQLAQIRNHGRDRREHPP